MKLYLSILISIQLTVVFSSSDNYDDIIEAIFSSFQNKQIDELENIELTEDSGYTPTVREHVLRMRICAMHLIYLYLIYLKL